MGYDHHYGSPAIGSPSPFYGSPNYGSLNRIGSAQYASPIYQQSVSLNSG